MKFPDMALVFFGLLPALTVRFLRRTRGEHLSTHHALLASGPRAFVGPSASRNTFFSVHDHGRQRSGGGRSTLSTLALT